MYISLYKVVNGAPVHITNLINAEIDFTGRVFDFNNFTAKGETDIDFSDASFYIINNEEGKFIYNITDSSGIVPFEQISVWSGICKNISRENENSNIWTFKGTDFREILDTEILIDYTQTPLENYSLKLSDVFNKIVAEIDSNTSFLLPLSFVIPEDTTDTSQLIDYRGTYLIKNAYSFLRTYLNVFQYYIVAGFNPITKKIVFTFINARNFDEVSIKLKDFEYSKTTTDTSVNMTVATLKWNTSEDIGGGISILRPRPSTLPTKVYYLGKDNNIYVDTMPSVNNRLYPVKTKVFEEEYLANAQFNAVYELANNRFVENIQLKSDNIYTPIDLKKLSLYTIIRAYDETGDYKYLPVSEMQYKITPYKEEVTIKLGFKKMLLTQIIKGN